MSNATYLAVSNQVALQQMLDVVASNIANVNTTAFKSQDVRFTDYLASIGGTSTIAFPQNAGITRDYDEGPITSTGNPLDLAIKGDAFLAVQTGAGTRYTRSGSLTLDAKGVLTDVDGDPVLDDRGNPITIPQGQGPITVSSDGTLSTASGQVAHIKLVHFASDGDLVSEGAGMFNANGMPEMPASGASVVQGSLEGSNVQPIVEMTRMMEILRSYQYAEKMIESENQRQMQAIQVLTKDA